MFDCREAAGPGAVVAGLRRFPFDLSGELVRSVSWAGTRFHALVLPDHREVGRRREAGLGAVADYLTLKAIATLPSRDEVPWERVDPVVAGFLDGAPRGVVASTPRGVKRLLVPPLRVVALIKVGPHWRWIGSLAALSQDASAVFVARCRPRELDRVARWARQAGVGLCYLSGPRLVDVIAPSSTPAPSIRRTRLVEVIYRCWLRQVAGKPTNLSHALSWFDGG